MTTPAALELTDQSQQQAARVQSSPTTSAPALTLEEYTRFLQDIFNQPQWRTRADREMDYVDGNQLDSDLLRRMRALGIPPAIEPLIGPAIDSVCGYEAKTRKDWRLTADGQGQEGDDVAAALNFKLNQAERHSGADKACGEAFKPELCVGIGWVEVAKEKDPFLFKYKCQAIHRNEIWWDMLAKSQRLRDARYLIRRKWSQIEQAMLLFPEKADLIKRAGGDSRWVDKLDLAGDGGQSTGLNSAYAAERGWTIEEQEWRDVVQNRVCIFEVWYRRWVPVVVLRSPDGRVVEYDQRNPAHVAAVARGLIQPERTVVARMFVSFWMGPHKLYDGPTPHPHQDFPYVPFWNKKEDRTGVPVGVVKGMMYLQDSVNSAISKIRWGLSSVMVTRTKGAYSGTDAQLRQQIARVDADIILNQEEMAKKGATFEVKRDFQLNEQQYKMLQDARLGIERASGITPGFSGQRGTATSGVQEQTQVEQTTQALADLMENFEEGRTHVGELLLAMLIADSGGNQESVMIRGTPPMPDRTVVLNQPQVDPHTGFQYLTNDVQRTRLKVALTDVPSTSSFRAQQLAAFSEAFKAMPPAVQLVVLPHLLALMDVPNKDDVIKAVQDSSSQMTEDQVQQRIQQALKDAQHDLKSRELELKYDPQRVAAELRELDARTENLDAKTKQALAIVVKTFIDAQFAAVQSAEVVTAIPQVTPVADVLLANAGGTPGNQPVPSGGGGAGLSIEAVKNKRTGMGFLPGAPGDTSPQTPATPADPASPFVGAQHGIETMRADSAPQHQGV